MSSLVFLCNFKCYRQSCWNVLTLHLTKTFYKSSTLEGPMTPDFACFSKIDDWFFKSFLRLCVVQFFQLWCCYDASQVSFLPNFARLRGKRFFYRLTAAGQHEVELLLQSSYIVVEEADLLESSNSLPVKEQTWSLKNPFYLQNLKSWMAWPTTCGGIVHRTTPRFHVFYFNAPP